MMRSKAQTIVGVAVGLVALVFVDGCMDGPDDGGDGGDADPQALTWISPGGGGDVYAGEPVQLSVATRNADARVVRFVVDGQELAACDPSVAEEDCRSGDLWRWTAPLAEGAHTLSAWFERADGSRVEATEVVTVLPADAANDAANDAADDDLGLVDERSADAADPAGTVGSLAASRGSLDPDRGFHSVFGGIAWAVRSQRVVLHANTPAGSVAAARSCMARYGASIRRWADHYKLSRASIVATAITESNCTNPAGSSDGLSSGPMQVTASTCAALTGLSRTTCRRRMHTSPDFSFEVGARYMATAYQRDQHHRDPPKIAAAYNAGSIRRTSSNRWHMVSTGNHIDRWVTAYNGYRRWETAKAAALVDDAVVDLTWDGAHVADAASLPAAAPEGTSVFVGDLAARDGDFYTFEAGQWRASTDAP